MCAPQPANPIGDPAMSEPFAPLHAGPRIVPTHPHAGMSSRTTALWEYFSKDLRWGTGLVARLTFDFMISARDFSRGRPILDAGAGHQRFRPFFDECVYLSQEHPAGIEFKNMQDLDYDLVSPLDERIPLRDGSIACVINTSVLEHVRRPEAFLAEAHRVLQPGGRIYIQVPFAYCEHEQPYDFQRPTRYGLEAWLRDAGFPKVSVLPSSSAIYGASWYLTHALTKELGDRGITEERETLLGIVKRTLEAARTLTNDYIDVATVMPVGWTAVAEKEGQLGERPDWDRRRWLAEIRE